MANSLNGMFDLFKTMTADSAELFDELRSGINANHTEITEAIERSFVQKQRRFEEVLKLHFGKMTEKSQRQREMLDRIEGYAVALNDSVSVALEEGGREMRALSEKEREHSKGIKQLLEEIQGKCQDLERLSEEKEKSRMTTVESVRARLQQNMVQNKEAKEEAYGLVAEVLNDVQEASLVVEQRSTETITDGSVVSEIMSKAKGAVQATREVFDGRMQEKSTAFEESLSVAQKCTTGDVERQSEAVLLVGQNVATVHEKTRAFVGDFDDFSANCMKSVRGFCTNELETYRPTGETPAKKHFQYPQSLSQTSPHGRILQRFRYDPNNSFNSSSDILPGLDGDEEGHMKARIEEGDEREAATTPTAEDDDEPEFLDAREDNQQQKEALVESRLSDNAENENPNVQIKNKRATGSVGKAANRALLEVQQRDTVYVLSDEVSGKGGGGGSGRRAVVRRSPLRTKSPANGRSPTLNVKSPIWRNS